MRNMSFALTTEQVRDHTKTVTRRIGWQFLKRGDLVQPVVKAQGLKKGERVEKIGGPIRIERVNRELLEDMTTRYDRPWEETAAEGFPDLTAQEFIDMFERHNGITDLVTRIEFSYVENGDQG